jgi:SRSO17 transposase
VFIPSAAQRLLLKFSPSFTAPTYSRWVVLLVAAILTTGRRTVTNLLRTVRGVAKGHASSFHRVLSRARWAPWKLARTLAGFIMNMFVGSGPVVLAVDDTVDEHRGKMVYGKGCHRDAVRSTHSFTAFRWGHKWVVLAILVRFPFATRSWALPVLVALYRSPEKKRRGKRRVRRRIAPGCKHRTQPEITVLLIAVLMRWFPERKVVLIGDGGYASHKLAGLTRRYFGRLTVVSHFHGDAALYKRAPIRRKTSKAGRPKVRGRRLACPEKVVKHAKRKKLRVEWYGGGVREVSVVSREGGWYRGGEGLVAVRWVHVRDLTGTHRDEYFFSTDPSMTPREIIGYYTRRWSIEVTFEEMRSCLGLETTRGRTENTVLRAAPSLFGLYSIVAALYAQLPQARQRKGTVAWEGKKTVTFSDAMCAVRRWIWEEWILCTSRYGTSFKNLPRIVRETVLAAMAPAA